MEGGVKELRRESHKMQKFQKVVGPFRAEASRSKIRYFFFHVPLILFIYTDTSVETAYIRYLKRRVCEIQTTLERA